MQALELKVPPPIVMALIAICMWCIGSLPPYLPVPALVRVVVALVVLLIGVAFSIAGVTTFKRAKTTLNPTKPETTTSLVSTGVYGITRNPMYVGLLFVLIGWAIYLSSFWALIGPLVLVLYLTRFQIQPEERVLATKFGADFVAYQARVRRWL
jgi:protein-S-isoprenylcysteine O-methyltransferase Ste14